MIRIALILAATTFATPAIADPCKAIPDRGPWPADLRLGVPFTGPVTYVGDGDGLCVATTPGRERDPATWVEVRIADFLAPELSEPGGRIARDVLAQVTAGKRVVCVHHHSNNRRSVAYCTVGGKRIGDVMRSAGAPEGGNGRRGQ